MAIDSENSPETLVVDLGSLSADGTVPAMLTKRRIKILHFSILNGAAISASDTDFAEIQLKVGSTVHGDLDTRSAAENGLAQNVWKDGRVVSAVVEKDSKLDVVYDETDAGTNVALTTARAQIVYANI